MHQDAKRALSVLIKHADADFEPAKELYKLFITNRVLVNYEPVPIDAQTLIAKYESKLGVYF